ncbi:MAG TPA: 3-methyl-2-oxobutanoate hydroxymethyltransferase [Chloroflexota bacterium]|nr:3-methyl-2-oxobutanoate hydroxymethyltransferase [Chloroflexota bacterium]
MAQVTIPELNRMKRDGQKIVVMTAYDFELARIVDRAAPEMILVGDSGGRYSLGYDDFNPVTLDEMILLTRSVSRGAKHAMVVGDLPFMTYQVTVEDAVRNAGRMMKESGADAIKLEGGEDYAPAVRAIVRAGIPVMAHMGITPMMAIGQGGYLSQDVNPLEEQIRRDALALQDAGAFSVVFTRVPPALASSLTKELQIPTLAGGGSGDDCDGQVCVMHNVFGLTVEELDQTKSIYGPLAKPIFDTAQTFISDVRAGKPVRSRRDS